MLKYLEETLKKVVLHSVATALAKRVFPVPRFNKNNRCQCYKNTTVNYHGNFNPTFSRVKMMQYITAILG
jgi:hypothetical protein